MTTVLVTGATGFIGQAVLPEILKSLAPEDRLFMLARKPFAVADRRVVTVEGDIASLEKGESLAGKADVIVHIAGEARLYGENDYIGSNVLATRQLVDLARKSRALQRFIFISSIAAMDRSAVDRCNAPLTPASPCCPRTAYGRSKRMAEEIILSSDLPYTIFRPGFVYGPGMRNDSHLRKLARLIRSGLPLHRLGFPGKISLIHVADLAIAIGKCVKGDSGKNRIYLAETEFMSLGEVLSLLGESLTGRKPLQLHIPAMEAVFQKLHSWLPVMVAGLFLDYLWMDDPAFRAELIDPCRQKSLSANVYDIARDLLRQPG